MQRFALNDLISWKESPYRKPLIIRGARQVGKTWLMREFARTAYKNYAYINFDNNERMKALFDGDLSIDRLIVALQIESGVVITPGDTLLVFDEVQEVPRALTSLKYFCENAPEHHIVAAGSLLGVALHPETSFPVGKVDFLDLYPLSFPEFILALGEIGLLKALESRDFSTVSVFKNRYIDLLRSYFYIGGMPEVVNIFASTKNFELARQTQTKILDAYEQDFSKHAPYATVPRIRMLWRSIPAQLAKENRKFIYGLVKEGSRAKEYELALMWLIDCGLVYKVPRVTKPSMPLVAYQDNAAFKLFILDVGLLGALSELDVEALLEGNSLFQEFKGALTEQYVLQQLKTTEKLSPSYWSAEKATAEVDFIFQYRGNIVPLEVKSAENLQSKSLKKYCEKYQPDVAVRTSLSDFREEDWLINIPLYAINFLIDVLDDSTGKTNVTQIK